MSGDVHNRHGNKPAQDSADDKKPVSKTSQETRDAHFKENGVDEHGKAPKGKVFDEHGKAHKRDDASESEQ